MGTTTPSPRELTDDEITAIENQIQWLEQVIGAQSVNGLFRTNNVITSTNCYEFVKKARDAIKDSPVTYAQSASARNELNSGWGKIDEAIETAGPLYKLQYIYCIPAFLTLVIFFSALMIAATRYNQFQIFGILPSGVLIAGATGAELRWVWWLIHYVELRQYAKSNFTSLLLAPFLGALLSLGIFAAYYGVSASVGQAPKTLDIVSLMLSLIAGYGWRETVDLLTNFTKSTIGSIMKKS